jgi:hypothetical protein
MDDGWEDDDDLDISGDVKENEEDGWGDETILFDDDDQEESETPTPTNNLTDGHEIQKNEEDGWGDESILHDDDEQEENETPILTKDLADGWGDEEEDDDFLNSFNEWNDVPGTIENALLEQQHEIKEEHNKNDFADGWGNDDSLSNLGDETSFEEEDNLVQSLEAYVESLRNQSMAKSINAILEFESTSQKAMELMEYYQHRPQLSDYTLTKELPRMDYTLITPTGDLVNDKDQIRSLLQDDDIILTRCANQSILADVLQFLTAQDMLIRPQYMAIAIAKSCQFTIDLYQQKLMVDCQLDLSLPDERGDRYSLASISVRIQFWPHSARIQYQVNAIHPSTIISKSTLKQTANFLKELDLTPTTQPSNQSMMRDQFLLNSLKVSTKGLSNAWSEMNSIVNVSGKLQMVLPDTDALLQAEQDSMKYIPEKDRPQSILGGLVRSGWSALANSVAIPDDHDPAIYGPPPPATQDNSNHAFPRPQPMQNHDLSIGFSRPPQLSIVDLSKGFPRPAPPPKKEESINLSKGFPRPAPSPKKEESINLSKGFPNPAPLKQAPQKEVASLFKGFPRPPVNPLATQNEIEVDLSKGFPRPPANPLATQNEIEVDLSKGFPRPPINPLVTKTEMKVDLSKGFPRPPINPLVTKTEIEVDLSKGFPRPPIDPLVTKTEMEVDLSKGFPRPPASSSMTHPNNVASPAAAVSFIDNSPCPTNDSATSLQNTTQMPTLCSMSTDDDDDEQDGWSLEEEDDLSLLLEDDNVQETSKSITTQKNDSQPPQTKEMLPKESFPPRINFDTTKYNPNEDIIPTRTRWRNPRPDRPYIVL